MRGSFAAQCSSWPEFTWGERCARYRERRSGRPQRPSWPSPPSARRRHSRATERLERDPAERGEGPRRRQGRPRALQRHRPHPAGLRRRARQEAPAHRGLRRLRERGAQRLARAPRRRRSLVLDSIGGVALSADEEQAASFGADVTGTDARARSVSGGLKKLWLHGKVQANLERSTRQVNAPAAWAAGYDGKGTKVAVLDTGTDLEPPDLKGRVSGSKNFTDSDTDTDRQGHGTHTISTVGGSGAESGGAKKGVAPGAELLSGKALNDAGYGLDSWIIAGMEWALASKADVVSMSLGDPSQTACDDPLAAAAERLSQQGPLFVIAAGNSGRGNNTVSSPGCAASVLTVGAVDRDDTTAVFSSRGPAGLPATAGRCPQVPITTEAEVSERAGKWSAVVDHAGASGKQVSPKVELADANGASVAQTVARAYDVR